MLERFKKKKWPAISLFGFGGYAHIDHLEAQRGPQYSSPVSICTRENALKFAGTIKCEV